MCSGKPVDQLVHRLDLLGLRGPVLLAPARDLPLEVAARLAESLEPDRAVVDRVQQRNHAVQLVPDREALRRIHPGQRLVPQHPPLDAVHDVERGADHALVLAQRVWSGDRKTDAVQRLDDAELPLHRMGRGQQFAQRLAPQHVAPAAGGKPVRRVRLSTAELLDLEAAGIALNIGAHVLRAGARRRTGGALRPAWCRQTGRTCGKLKFGDRNVRNLWLQAYADLAQSRAAQEEKLMRGAKLGAAAKRRAQALLGQSSRESQVREARAAQLLRVPRPRHTARHARQARCARDPRTRGQGAARRMARARLPGAVRLRAQGLGALRVRGGGEVLMKAGTCFYQPPRIRHREIEHSKDVELLEVVAPAGFRTYSAAEPAARKSPARR